MSRGAGYKTAKHAISGNIKELRQFPWWLSGKESACQNWTHGFDLQFGMIPHVGEQLSPYATTVKPGCHNYLAHVPQLLSPQILEPVLCNRRCQCSEKPTHHNQRAEPISQNQRKAQSARKPQHSQNKKAKTISEEEIKVGGAHFQQQLEPDMEQQTGSKLGKKYVKAIYVTVLI